MRMHTSARANMRRNTGVYRYKLKIAYDGSQYFGWQVQPGKRTIQGQLENAFFSFTGQHIKVHASGRTDQGVHAAGQVAHVDVPSRFSGQSIEKALNALLDNDIRILQVDRSCATFHAQKNAVSKEYRYFIWNNEVMPPFLRYYRTHIPQPLDVECMNQAARMLVGKKDFASFTANPNRKVETTVRHLSALSVKRKGHEVVIIARSDGFLYKMVRSIAGFLIRVGEGAILPLETQTILRTHLRTAKVQTAPPQGLFLWHVYF